MRVTIALALFGLLTSAAQAQTTLNYIGSSTVGRFVQDAAEVYQGATFKINTAPESGGGENATAAGKADLGGVAREVKPQILERGVEQYLIGRDAIGVIVHPDNPVRELSSEQLKGVFTGEIDNWQALGWEGEHPIHTYIVNPQSATRRVFQQAVLGEADYKGEHLQTIRPDSDILDRIANDPNGIGILSFAIIGDSESVARVAPDGQEPSVDNPDYPITRPLYLITKGAAEGAAAQFIEWAKSAEGQQIVKRYFVGVE